MTIQRINHDGFLSNEEIYDVVQEACATMAVDGKRVLFIVPDQTRSMPMPLMFRALYDALHERVAKMDYLIALGTHPPMTEDMIDSLFDLTREERTKKYADVGIFNHDWQNPDALKENRGVNRR